MFTFWLNWLPTAITRFNVPDAEFGSSACIQQRDTRVIYADQHRGHRRLQRCGREPPINRENIAGRCDEPFSSGEEGDVGTFLGRARAAIPAAIRVENHRW